MILINNYLTLKKQKDNTLVTTVLFDDKYETLYYREDIKKVKKLTSKEYYVRGCTALYDAIGITINRLKKDVKNEKVLFVITTDGLENASKEYNKEFYPFQALHLWKSKAVRFAFVHKGT